MCETQSNLNAKFEAKAKLMKGEIHLSWFIDAHAHFFEYGLTLTSTDLVSQKAGMKLLRNYNL